MNTTRNIPFLLLLAVFSFQLSCGGGGGGSNTASAPTVLTLGGLGTYLVYSKNNDLITKIENPDVGEKVEQIALPAGEYKFIYHSSDWGYLAVYDQSGSNIFILSASETKVIGLFSAVDQAQARMTVPFDGDSYLEPTPDIQGSWDHVATVYESNNMLFPPGTYSFVYSYTQNGNYIQTSAFYGGCINGSLLFISDDSDDGTTYFQLDMLGTVSGTSMSGNEFYRWTEGDTLIFLKANFTATKQ
jgi:hypothetical protein